jgi:hypothetical protein
VSNGTESKNALYTASTVACRINFRG